MKEPIICVNCGTTSNTQAGQCLICGGEALAQSDSFEENEDEE